MHRDQHGAAEQRPVHTVESGEGERLVGAGDEDDLRLVVETDQAQPLEIQRLRVPEQEHAGVGMRGAQVPRRRDRRGQQVFVGEVEPMLAQTGADVSAALRGGVRDHAQRQAGLAQPHDGRSRARQRPPRRAEHAVQVEQQAIDLREPHQTSLRPHAGNGRRSPRSDLSGASRPQHGESLGRPGQLIRRARRAPSPSGTQGPLCPGRQAPGGSPGKSGPATVGWQARERRPAGAGAGT